MNRQYVHAELFRLTAPWHARLDSHPALAPLLRPGLQVQAYGQVLQRLHACLQPCETALSDWERGCRLQGPECLQGLEYQPRCAALAQDISRLGLSLLPGPPAVRPACDADYLGQRYVLEGAALGSARIRQQLQRQAPQLPSAAMQYLAAQQAQVAGWPQFLQQLEQRLADAAALAAATAAATGVFRHFLQVLDECSHAD